MEENQKIVIHRIGESFRDCTRIVKEPTPAPGPEEILVRNHYAGVNGVYDQVMCSNKVDHTPVVPPADTGVEAIGLVVAAGRAVSALRPGDAVVTVAAGGGYRHYQVCSAQSAIAVPEVSPEILALIPSGVSALVALERVGELSSGETVCITAAAGGLGNIATQVAINAGNHVIAVCGSDEKARWLRNIGAARVVQYKNEDLAEILASEYKDSIDIAMDSVGGKTFDALLDNLAPFGRLVVCGFTSDRLQPERVLQERVYRRLYWKAASIRGFMNYRFAEYGVEARSRLLDSFSSGALAPLIDPQPFAGLESAAGAVEYLLAGENFGKVLLDLRPNED